MRIEDKDGIDDKVIAAEGEQKSSKALKEAADIIAMSPAALQLRYLQVRTAGDLSPPILS